MRPDLLRRGTRAGASARAVGGDLRQAWSVTDIDSAASAASVARGMRALLARRDGALAEGETPVGWKIGFNTPAIQEHFGLTDPVVGYLTDAGVSPDGATVSLAGWLAPAVEVELAIRVGDDGAVAGLAPALELVDLAGSFDDIEQVLAGNICHRERHLRRGGPGGQSLDDGRDGDQAGTLVAEGALVEEPSTTVTFVRSFLARHGATLRGGDRIIAGSVVAPVAVAAGDELSVSFGPLGHLGVSFGP